MISDKIICILHIILFLFFILSPFVDDCAWKINSLILLVFILFHFIFKYGKCGIINIERFFLKENFKNGFCYRLIKPVISHKNNIFYEQYFNILVLYIIILLYQVFKNNCLKKLYNIYQTILKNNNII